MNAPNATSLARWPAQSHAAPVGEHAHRFAPIFERYRGTIPLEYLRALVEHESGGNPNAQSQATRGLLQIRLVVLADYNTRHGTAYQAEHLLDPAINIAIGCELLRLIIGSYHRHHPQVPNLRADWTNPRFVELLTFGWRAGFSEASGVGRVASYLEWGGITELTIEQVHQAVPAAGASKHLADATSVRWCKSVAARYARERAGRPRYRDASWWAVKTPGVILDEMRAAKTEIEALGRDIHATHHQGQFVTQWDEFAREFAGFWSAHSGSWTDRMWRGTYDKAVEFRERAADWRRKFEQLGGAPTSPPPKPPTEHALPPGFSIPWKPIAAVGSVLAGALILPTVIRTLQR
jgi:hypothetical protein